MINGVTRCFTQDNEITVNIDGQAVLLGMESGNHNNHENYKAHARKVPAAGYWSIFRNSGGINVRISSPALREKPSVFLIN